MKSVRLNKEGKVIPSEINAFSNAWEGSDRYEAWARGRYPGYSHTHSRDSGIMGVSHDDDEDWLARRNRQASCSVLTDMTSLGKPVAPRIVIDHSAANAIRDQPRQHDQDGLNQFLVQMSRFTPGDFVTFNAYPSMGNMVSWTTISYILSVDRLITECVWSDKESVPKPFLLLDLTPMLPNRGKYLAARFSNCLYCRHLTQDERNNLIKDNVQLQDHIRQAQAAAKAGTLTVS